MSTIYVQLARTKEEFLQAFALMEKAQVATGNKPTPGTDGLWLLKQHSLPSSNVIVALHEGKVVGTLTLFGENPFRLPAEQTFNFEKLRTDLEGRLAEISMLGIHEAWTNRSEIKSALYHFAVCFGTTYCHYDAFVSECTEAWAAQNEKLGYRKLASKGNKVALWLDARLAPDYRQSVPEGINVSYNFPEQKFFLVAHQNMSAEVLVHLFTERTRLFKDLNDLELRVLKSIYDYGDYAKALPERALNLPFEKFPRFRRFPMNCDGYLCDGKGERIHLLVLDVSREGLKVRVEETLQNGKAYALTISVGVTKQAEIIASTIWVDKHSQIAGLALRSKDKNWAELIEYLEADFLKAAA
ncbi:MAG: N-acyl amino acid synthase FeeM domain-containing protein [Bdellovibrionota bacterium]